MPSSVSFSERPGANYIIFKLLLADSNQESATVPSLGELAQETAGRPSFFTPSLKAYTFDTRNLLAVVTRKANSHAMADIGSCRLRGTLFCLYHLHLLNELHLMKLL